MRYLFILLFNCWFFFLSLVFSFLSHLFSYSFLCFLCLNPLFCHRCLKLLDFVKNNLFCLFTFLCWHLLHIFLFFACLLFFSLSFFAKKGIHFCFYNLVFLNFIFFCSLSWTSVFLFFLFFSCPFWMYLFFLEILFDLTTAFFKRKLLYIFSCKK